MYLLITLKYKILFYLIPYQEEFQPVKYYLSRIITSRNIKLTKKKCKIQFLSCFCWFFLNFTFKTYGTLKMFLLSAQNNSYIVSSSYVEGHLKQNLSLDFMLNFGWFPALQNLGVFWKLTVEQILKPFSDWIF